MQPHKPPSWSSLQHWTLPQNCFVSLINCRTFEIAKQNKLSGQVIWLNCARSALKNHHVQDHQENGAPEARDPQAHAGAHIGDHLQAKRDPGIQILCPEHQGGGVLEPGPEEFWHVELPSFPETKNALLPEVRISKRRLPGIWDAQ